MNERSWAIGVLLSTCVVACHAPSDGPEPAASASASPSALSALSAIAKQHNPRRNLRGGVDALIFNAANDLPTLTDDQKTKIEAAEDEMTDHDPGPQDAVKAFSTDLAGQIRAGKIDTTKLGPDETAMDTALDAMLDKRAKALSDLHAALDATQRTTIALNLHAAVVGAGPEPAVDHDAGAIADRVSHQVDRMASDLSLDDAQKKQVAAVLTKDEKAKAATPPPDKRKDLDAVLTAFQGDPFDAKAALSQAMFGGKPAHQGMDEQAKLTASLLPILHPDQREKLASAAEKTAMPTHGQGPNMSGVMRAPGMHGPGMMRVGGQGAQGGGGGQP